MEIEGKTAMEQFMDYLHENTNVLITSDVTTFFLSKEKKQIIEASNSDLKFHGWETGEVYYDETYPATNPKTVVAWQTGT